MEDRGERSEDGKRGGRGGGRKEERRGGEDGVRGIIEPVHIANWESPLLSNLLCPGS